MEGADESIHGEDIPDDPTEPAFHLLSLGQHRRHLKETCSCRAVSSAGAGVKGIVTAISAGFMASRGHIAGAPFSLLLSKLSHVSREGPNVTEKAMTVAAVGGASSLSQLYNAQQAQALSAVTVDAPAASTPDGSTTTSTTDSSNSLMGLTTSNLDSQTLQALLDLTQTDPSDPSQAGQSTGQTTGQTTGQSTGQSTGQAQGAHHHHHHHGGGGMMQAQSPSSDPSQFSTTAAGSTSPAADTAEDATDASLESALLNA